MSELVILFITTIGENFQCMKSLVLLPLCLRFAFALEILISSEPISLDKATLLLFLFFHYRN